MHGSNGACSSSKHRVEELSGLLEDMSAEKDRISKQHVELQSKLCEFEERHEVATLEKERAIANHEASQDRITELEDQLIILADEAKEMCSKHKELEQKLMADRIAKAAQIEGNVAVVRNEKKHDGA